MSQTIGTWSEVNPREALQTDALMFVKEVV
jgi:hypothetical protein